jgi:hypothetical protein
MLLRDRASSQRVAKLRELMIGNFMQFQAEFEHRHTQELCRQRLAGIVQCTT